MNSLSLASDWVVCCSQQTSNGTGTGTVWASINFPSEDSESWAPSLRGLGTFTGGYARSVYMSPRI